jgi:hypothetical protein
MQGLDTRRTKINPPMLWVLKPPKAYTSSHVEQHDYYHRNEPTTPPLKIVCGSATLQCNILKSLMEAYKCISVDVIEYMQSIFK